MKENFTKRNLVIIGAGFGGVFAAKQLANHPDLEITMIDRENHHLFQPLLYQVAAGILAPMQIATPIRSVFKEASNVTTVMDNVVNIDRDKQVVITEKAEISYDYLIMATGSMYNYFGNEHWVKHTHKLKSLNDAIRLKYKIYNSLEKALLTKDPVERERLLTFIVVGGGPTGVEMAGIIAEVTKKLCQEEFKALAGQVKVILLEGAGRILLAMKEELGEYAVKELNKLGVEVKLNTIVSEIKDGRVLTRDGDIMFANTTIWAAGVRGASSPGFEADDLTRDRRIPVNEFLNPIGEKNVFIIGDISSGMQDGKPLPATAAVAKQQGVYIANALKAKLNGAKAEPFVYKDLGNLATIGRNAAVAQIGSISFTGFAAWAFWGLVHIFLLISFRNQLEVFTSWIWTYVLGNIDGRIVINHDDMRGKDVQDPEPALV